MPVWCASAVVVGQFAIGVFLAPARLGEMCAWTAGRAERYNLHRHPTQPHAAVRGHVGSAAKPWLTETEGP